MSIPRRSWFHFSLGPFRRGWEARGKSRPRGDASRPMAGGRRSGYDRPRKRGRRSMKHLSGMDATFFHVETAETPMHVGSLCLTTLPDGYQGDYYEDYKKQIGGRLHLAEVFQRKLAL